MQRERRRDPYPWTWEIPAAITLVVLTVVVFGIQLARSVANLTAGAGWTWPDTNTGTGPSSPIGTAFWTSLPDILRGDSGAGLPAPRADSLASNGTLWIVLGLTQLGLLTLTAWAATYAYLRWGPGRMRGMATAPEAEKLLGVTRLRKVAPIVRPDLHGKHRQPAPTPVCRLAADADIGIEPANSQIGRGLSSPWLRTPRKEER